MRIDLFRSAAVLLCLALGTSAHAQSTCNSGTLRPFDQAPVSGIPIPIAPSGETIFEAEHFNCGGQNVAYHDNIAGNAGNAAFRTSEDIDIRTSIGSASPVITNFEIGEFVTYTINVATAGTYDLGVRASSNNATTVSQHFEIDGVNVGTVSIPNTGSWDTFNWYTKTGVTLSAGQHVLKLQADQQYATIDQIRVVPTGGQSSASCGAANLCADFETSDTLFNTPVQTSPTNTAFVTTTTLGNLTWSIQNLPNCTDQSRVECRDRISLVSPGRDGGSAIKMTTLDLDQYDGATWERTQLNLALNDTGVTEGSEQWWAHSILIPTDSVLGSTNWGMSLMSFHSGGQLVTFTLGAMIQPGATGIFFRAWNAGEGGIDSIHTQYTYTSKNGTTQIGQCILNDDFAQGVWFDFVHRIKWSSTGQGRHTIWARKAGSPVKKVLDRGIGSPLNQPINTLFSGALPWLKLGSYHDPLDNQNTSAVHDRLRRGTSADAVRMEDFPVDLNASATNPDGTLVGCPNSRP